MTIARWVFNIRQPLLLENVEPLVTSLTDDDKPNIVPVSNLLNFLPKIECDRLLQFRLEDDMRRALVGRLMIHSFFAAHHGCRWDQLVFSRSETNKPILVKFPLTIQLTLLLFPYFVSLTIFLCNGMRGLLFSWTLVFIANSLLTSSIHALYWTLSNQ